MNRPTKFQRLPEVSLSNFGSARCSSMESSAIEQTFDSAESNFAYSETGLSIHHICDSQAFCNCDVTSTFMEQSSYPMQNCYISPDFTWNAPMDPNSNEGIAAPPCLDHGDETAHVFDNDNAVGQSITWLSVEQPPAVTEYSNPGGAQLLPTLDTRFMQPGTQTTLCLHERHDPLFQFESPPRISTHSTTLTALGSTSREAHALDWQCHSQLRLCDDDPPSHEDPLFGAQIRAPRPDMGHHYCQWSDDGSGCGTRVEGNKHSISTHLQTRHHLAVPWNSKVPQRCRWGGCMKVINAESIVRHVLTVHLRITSKCDACGSTFARSDSLQRHIKNARRTCVSALAPVNNLRDS